MLMGGKDEAERRAVGRVLPTVALAVLVSLVTYAVLDLDRIPAFGSMTDLQIKKLRFFEYLSPQVVAVNRQVLAQRERLSEIIVALDSNKASGSDIALLHQLAVKYRIPIAQHPGAADVEALLHSIDVVPVSLALAQAAKESGWGTSRFAQEQRNFFGLWCFEQGCGAVPVKRLVGASHEVAQFSSVEDGVHSYVLSLNRNPAYAGFRRLRASLRAGHQPIVGAALVMELRSYSQQEDYVGEVSSMMRVNKLARYDVD